MHVFVFMTVQERMLQKRTQNTPNQSKTSTRRKKSTKVKLGIPKVKEKLKLSIEVLKVSEITKLIIGEKFEEITCLALQVSRVVRFGPHETFLKLDNKGPS